MNETINLMSKQAIEKLEDGNYCFMVTRVSKAIDMCFDTEPYEMIIDMDIIDGPENEHKTHVTRTFHSGTKDDVNERYEKFCRSILGISQEEGFSADDIVGRFFTCQVYGCFDRYRMPLRVFKDIQPLNLRSALQAGIAQGTGPDDLQGFQVVRSRRNGYALLICNGQVQSILAIEQGEQTQQKE